jgi:hypothetical protein
MHRSTHNRTVRTKTPPMRRSAVARLRLAFFAQAGEFANRYHVRFERVLEHVWDARRWNRRLLLRAVTNMDDLVHAIACIDEVGLAWSDLAERYERTLIRRCRGGQDEIEATVFVRRLFADVRRRNREPFVINLPSLRGYAGTRPLRTWLADRLNAARMRQEWMINIPRAPAIAAGFANAERNGTFDQGHWIIGGSVPLLRLTPAPAAPVAMSAIEISESL